MHSDISVFDFCWECQLINVSGGEFVNDIHYLPKTITEMLLKHFDIMDGKCQISGRFWV